MPHRRMIQQRQVESRSSTCTLMDMDDMKTAISTPADEPSLPNLIPDDLSLSSDYYESEDEEMVVTRKVTFKSSLKMRKIASHRKYSKQERAATWYSAEEYKKLRDSASRTAKRMARGYSVDKDGKESSRGLEHRIAESHKIRQTKRLDIIWTVLGEQEEMFENGEEVDHEQIAQIYSMCAKDCVAEARKRGIEDELAVRVPKAPALPSSNDPVFTNTKKADDIMSLVASLSMKAAMTVQRR
ncbi:unnamed protein product [Cylindrotheca closterium]|uniref:Uncharacterized protein n=1 Tax=Cylindrotheca closterium TaxID=2856 RepID=A0AAD2JHP1_9STRA|nr:unnamed protein product [Cylindrotheca closterium]